MEHHQPRTIAILGANTLLDRILARLLKDEGYGTKLLKAPLTGPIDDLLNAVDVVLLAPHLDADLRWTLPKTMSSPSEATHRIPVLSLSVPLQVALLDELAVNVHWQSLFEGLVQEIDWAIVGAEAGVEMLSQDTGGPPKEEDLRSGAA